MSFGVDIKATRPASAVQSLAMLSGGEQALTSVALLFAILTVNPSPFVMLDEVDAALDEANTSRFAETLGLLASRTQFIVVTHNRDTMKAAQTLYGVTMDETGISTLLSLKLAEAEKVARAA
ncbi:MAG: AAA family ATPase [Hymenobacter sp.]